MQRSPPNTQPNAPPCALFNTLPRLTQHSTTQLKATHPTRHTHPTPTRPKSNPTQPNLTASARRAGPGREQRQRRVGCPVQLRQAARVDPRQEEARGERQEAQGAGGEGARTGLPMYVHLASLLLWLYYVLFIVNYYYYYYYYYYHAGERCRRSVIGSLQACTRHACV